MDYREAQKQVSKPTDPQAQEIANEIRWDCIALYPCKPGKAHELCRTCQWADFILRQQKRIDALAEQRKRFRVRVFTASVRSGSPYHSTACTIWGDDGRGGTEEHFPAPLPCNCGALINFEGTQSAEQRKALLDLCDSWMQTPGRLKTEYVVNEVRRILGEK